MEITLYTSRWQQSLCIISKGKAEEDLGLKLYKLLKQHQAVLFHYC